MGPGFSDLTWNDCDKIAHIKLVYINVYYYCQISRFKKERDRTHHAEIFHPIIVYLFNY